MNENLNIHVVAIIRFQPEHASTVHAALIQHALNSRTEAGCLRYDVFLQNDAPVLVTQETWLDSASEKAHMTGPFVAALLAKISGYLTAPPEITYHSQLV
jgi:quinol monooxygenase YgiN